MKEQIHRTPRRPLASWGLFALVGVLLSFGALNIAVRTTSHLLVSMTETVLLFSFDT